jgi:methionyl aminopeptidase
MIPIKTSKEIETMRQGGKILASILDIVIKKVKPGVGTQELDQLAEDEIRLAGGFPIFKGYHGFPTAICTCINDEVVHAPAKPNRILKSGDILTLDLGMRYPAKNGMIVDMAKTISVGKINKSTKKLINVTEQTLTLSIKKIKAGAYLGDISHTIQQHAEKNGFSVVRDLSGHGVGKRLHEDPQILNYGKPQTGPILKAGMTLAIEPMINIGEYSVIEDKKGIFKTKDNKLSAHFEHTILVTQNGAEILTQ